MSLTNVSYIELNISCKPELTDILIAEISDYCKGFVETDDGFLAYIEEDSFDSGELKSFISRYLSRSGVKVSTRVVEHQNWNALWEQNFQAVVIDDKCRIRASFHHESSSYPYEIIINPKMSFGTGHHETTSLMISLLLQLDLAGKKVLDIGSGTGILAVLASKLGAGYVEAIDIEEVAVENGRENLDLNQTNDVNLYQGTIHNVNTTGFDLILANLTKQDIMNELHAYAELLTDKGSLIISGFYQEDVPEITDHAKPPGFIFLNKVSRNDWAACVFLYNSKN